MGGPHVTCQMLEMVFLFFLIHIIYTAALSSTPGAAMMTFRCYRKMYYYFVNSNRLSMHPSIAQFIILVSVLKRQIAL